MNGVELIASWLTPNLLFCFLNLMIGIIFITSSTLNPFRKQQTLGDEHPPQLLRVPSFFERVKSMNLSRTQHQQPDPTRHTVPAQEPDCHAEEAHHVTRSMSDTVAKTAPAVRTMKKSASEKGSAEMRKELDEQRPAAAEDEAVDAKADDFINRFRQQLMLQRLNSILRQGYAQQRDGEIGGG